LPGYSSFPEQYRCRAANINYGRLFPLGAPSAINNQVYLITKLVIDFFGGQGTGLTAQVGAGGGNRPQLPGKSDRNGMGRDANGDRAAAGGNNV